MVYYNLVAFKKNIMARKCALTGKKTGTGNNRPFSMKATKRTFRPNLFKKRIFNPLTGRVERVKLSAKALRTLKKWVRAGAPEEEVVQAKASTAPSHNEEKHRVKKEKLTPKQKKEAAAAQAAEAKAAADDKNAEVMTAGAEEAK